jgi:hypothetical protein
MQKSAFFLNIRREDRMSGILKKGNKIARLKPYLNRTYNTMRVFHP